MVSRVGLLMVAAVLASGVRIAHADEAAGTAHNGASVTVTALNDALAATVARGSALDYRGRFDQISPSVNEAFDLSFMAEKAIGRHWKDLADADRTRWLTLFREYTTANYAANLQGRTEQQFAITGEEPGPNDTVLVRTRITAPNVDPIDLAYRLQRTNDTWKIVDVYYKGTVSELALRRSDYTSVLDRDGFEALATRVRGTIDDLAAGRAVPEQR